MLENSWFCDCSYYWNSSAYIVYAICANSGGNFIPITPVEYNIDESEGFWTSVDLSTSIPVGTKEVGGYISYQTTASSGGGMGLIVIAPKSNGIGSKRINFFSDVPGYHLSVPFRISLLENRILYYQTAKPLDFSETKIVISEYK